MNTKGYKNSLVVKVYLLVTVLLVIGSSVTALVLYRLSLEALREEIASKLKSIAAATAVILEPEKIKLIQDPADEGTVTYHELQQKLQQVQRTGPDKLRYLYVIAKKGQSYIYILDATPIGAGDHSTVGDEFPIADYPAALHGFRYPSVDPKPLPELEFGGVSQSGYAPIRDESGKTIAIIGIDMDVSKIKADEHKILAAAFETILASLILALLLGIVFSHYLTKPILMVTNGINKIAGGNFNAHITVGRRDELGMLAQSFNEMTTDLQKARYQLTQMNLELEEKVTQRTVELSETNRAISEILDSMGEGIFTINPDLSINPQYSHFTEMIFESTELAGKRIEEVLFSGSRENELKMKFVGWLSLIFELPVVNWSSLEQIQPVSELTLPIHLSNKSVKNKDLQLMFHPIFQQGPGSSKVAKIMVIIQDVTEKKNLKREVEKKTKDYQDNLHDIIEVIQLDQALFMAFIDECKAQLLNFEPRLVELQSEQDNEPLVNDLLRILHTIKGNANQFRLVRIGAKIQEIETLFSKMRSRELELTDEVLHDIFDKLDRTQQMIREIEGVYAKFIQGKKREIAPADSVEHNSEVISIARIHMDELDRLIELVQRGCSLEMNSDNRQVLQEILTETENSLWKMKRVPIGRVFARLPRMVKEIAAELGKIVVLVIKGEEIMVDRAIFEKIGDPVIHIMRNALDHGIETPEDRIRQGKPKKGTIDITVGLNERELVITIRDDGRGIDLDLTREKAVAKGFVTKEEAERLSENEIIDLLFIPGFSTTDRVTEISGQGVGMDVVRTSMRDLNGRVQLTTVKNQGTQLVLVIPINK